jgi:hypothetical protein
MTKIVKFLILWVIIIFLSHLSQNWQYKNACIEQARKFDTEIFIEKIKKQIEKQQN